MKQEPTNFYVLFFLLSGVYYGWTLSKPTSEYYVTFTDWKIRVKIRYGSRYR